MTTLQERSILNIKACLEAAGSNLDKVVGRRIYIIDMKQFRAVDSMWAKYFEEPFPVSTCVQVSIADLMQCLEIAGLSADVIRFLA